MLLTVKPIKI